MNPKLQSPNFSGIALMAVEIKMPQLSDTMSSGKILAWRKNEGDTISRGDVLAEVETDKANLDIESFFQGTLLKILTPAGETAKVGDLIAYIGDPREKDSLGTKQSSSVAPPSSPSQAPMAKSEPSTHISTTPVPPTSAQAHRSDSEKESVTPSSGDRVKASPLARRLAEQSNVDLTTVSGSGPSGRIVRKDIERMSTEGSTSATNGARGYPSASEAPSPSSPPTSYPMSPSASASIATQSATNTPGGTLTPLSKMRETIARRMQESVTQAPHFYSTTSIDMGAVSALREHLKSRDDFHGISINHFVIKAAGYALTREPRVNCSYRDGQVYTPPGINIGIITAVEDGLLIPVIRDAGKLSLRDLVFEAKAGVERARAGRPNSTDLTGGTFSISNMGMFDVENFTAIINPGQGAVLAVSATREQPIVRNGALAIGKQMKVTLSVDHRIIDGVMAARFLGFFKEALENPTLMFL